MTTSHFKERWFVLAGKEVKKVCSLEEWAKYIEEADRHVAKTKLEKYWVSTIFLGIDHSFGFGPPKLFETMVFPIKNGEVDYGGEQYQERWSTYKEAEAGHKAAVEKFEQL